MTLKKLKLTLKTKIMKFEIRLSKNGESYYFVLKANNNKVIAMSQMYESKQACKKGIKSVKLCWFAKVIDTTKTKK